MLGYVVRLQCTCGHKSEGGVLEDCGITLTCPYVYGKHVVTITVVKSWEAAPRQSLAV